MHYTNLSIVASTLAALVVASALGKLLARAGFPLPPSAERMGCVDGLRGYLALSVMAHHFVAWMDVSRSGEPWGTPRVPFFNELGQGAVGLFFMITGFVFYRRVLTGFQQTNWVAVAITRVFRIMPLLLVSIGTVAAIAMARHHTLLQARDVGPLLNWMFCWDEPGLAGEADAGRINAYVLWSLRYEWLFYLLVLPGCALLVDLIRGRLPTFVVPAALVALWGVNRICHTQWPLVEFLPLFAAGMIAYEVRAHARLVGWLRKPAVGALVLTALLAAMLVFPWPISLALPAFVAFFLCVACGNSLFGMLTARGALVLGEVSFSIYLLHGILLSLVFVEGGRITGSLNPIALPLLMPLVASTVVVLSCATYLLVERPAMRLGSRLAKRWTGARVRSRSLEVEFAP